MKISCKSSSAVSYGGTKRTVPLTHLPLPTTEMDTSAGRPSLARDLRGRETAIGGCDERAPYSSHYALAADGLLSMLRIMDNIHLL